MIFNLIKKSFRQVVENNSIVLFFVLYSILTSLIMTFIQTKASALSLGICTVLLSAVFLAGWFQIIKETAKEEIEKIKEKNYGAIFLEAIGKNFVFVLISLLLYMIALTSVLFITTHLANHFFGSINFLFQDLTTLTNDKVMEYILKLPIDKQYTLYGWQLSFLVAIGVFSFFFMNFCPALMDEKQENVFLKPFFAFFNSIKFLFKNFFGCLLIYILICFTHIFLEILNSLSSFNIVLSVISLFIFIYFIAIAIMLIFNYYEEKNNCSDGPDCIGENESCDSIGESNQE